MSLMQALLFGIPADIITLESMQASDTTGRVINAYIRVNAAGTVSVVGDDFSTGNYNWINNTGNASLYQLRVTNTSGSGDGVFGTWLDLNVDHEYTSINGNANFTFEIRDAATSTVQATANGLVQVPF